MKRAKRDMQPTKQKLPVHSTKQTKITKNGGKLKKTFITAESRQGTELIVSNNNTNDTDTCDYCNQKIENERLENADEVSNSLDSQPEKEQDLRSFSCSTIDLDDDFDDIKGPAITVSENVYKKACSKLGIVPSSFFFNHLKELNVAMAYHGLGPNGTRAVAIALVSNLTIENLDVSYNGIGTEGLSCLLDMLTSNVNIKHINLAGNCLRSRGAWLLMDSLKTNKNLTSLDISDNGFTEKDAECIAKLVKKNKFLRHLAVRQNGFNENSGVSLAKAIEDNATLTSLDLSWNHLRQRGAITLCWSLYINNTIKYLNLAWNGFGMEGCHEMGKALMRNRGLTELDLSANRVSLSAFRQLLRGVAKNTRLKILRIGVNPLTTDGATAILRAICASNSALVEIDLKDVSVDTNFVNLLEEVQEHRHLAVTHGITLRHDDIKQGQKGWVIDTDDPVAILFEYMKQKNFRLIDLLHALDKDNSDSLSRQELQNGLLTNDIPLSSRSLDILMKKLDINQDGSVNYEELVIKHKEYVRRATRLKMQADVSLSHFQSFDKLEQIREAIRLKIALGVNKGNPHESQTNK